jgi:cell division protein FtsN
MRALFLTLLLANGAFFAWATWVDVRPQSGAPAAVVGRSTAPRLTLVEGSQDSSRPTEAVAERTIEPEPSVSAEMSAEFARQVAASACLSVGPFRSLSEAGAAAATLRSQGFEPRQRVEAGEVWVGYWVSWRGAATREQADAAAAMLAERGITDTYILPGGESPHVLSLGVFTDRRRAERRREEVGLLGLEATISDRRQPGSVYWIDVDRGENPATIDPDRLQAEPGRIVRIEVMPCPPQAGTSVLSGDEGLPMQSDPGGSEDPVDAAAVDDAG